MPRKKHHSKTTFTKPQAPTHPSLGRSEDVTKIAPARRPTSVNGLIDHLRRAQVAPAATDHHIGALSPPTPTLNAIPHILSDQRSSSPLVSAALSPREQMAARRAARGPAGPPPPRSWLTSTHINSYARTLRDSRHAPANARAQSNHTAARVASLPIAALPDLQVPREASLQRLVLRKVADNWPWHAENDGTWIGAMLPERLRAALLLELAKSNVALNRSELESIIWEWADELESTQDDRKKENDDGVESDWEDWEQQDQPCGGLSHLTVGPSLGTRLSYKDLSEIIQGHSLIISSSTKNDGSEKSTTMEQLEMEANAMPRSIPSRMSFELTHLSLSHASNASWRALLSPSFSAVLGSLTHLDLSYWPFPTVTPNAARTGATTLTPTGPVNYSATDFYVGTGICKANEAEWAEAASVLRRLGRTARKLVWLGLDGCGSWAPVWLYGLDLSPTHTSQTTSTGSAGWDNYAQNEAPINVEHEVIHTQGDAIIATSLPRGVGARGAVDWLGAWRGLRTIRFTDLSEVFPEEIYSMNKRFNDITRRYFADHIWTARLEKTVQRVRAQAGLPGLKVERGSSI